jgi:plastocyanin
MPTLRRARRPALGLALGSLLLLLVPAATAADRDVRIVDFAYAPATVTIRVGDTVTWINRDPVEHTATATNGSFDTGMIAPDGSARIRFTRAGTYAYLCTPHPDMRGTVVVRARSSRPPDTSTEIVATPTDATDPVPVGPLAVLGAAALLVVDLRLRRRTRS